MKLRHYKTGEIVHMSIKEVLEEINRDRSEEWIDFNEDEILEGLDFTDYDLLREQA